MTYTVIVSTENTFELTVIAKDSSVAKAKALAFVNTLQNEKPLFNNCVEIEDCETDDCIIESILPLSEYEPEEYYSD